MPPRIMITGAQGFAGRHMATYLRETCPAPPLHTAHFDITDPATVMEAVSRFHPTHLLHLAGVSAVGAAAAAPDLAWRVNLHGTLNLARAVLARAPDCRFVHVSSSEIYGRSFLRAAPLDEDAPPAPVNAYGASKAAADLALGAMLGEGLRLLRLRPANHTGPGQSPAFVIPAFARQIAMIEAGAQEKVIKTGSLSARRDFLDVRDVCAAYAAALALEGEEAGEILNIASGRSVAVGDILDTLIGLTGLSIRVETDPARLRPGEIPETRLDPARARARLGWEPRIPLAETLRGVLAYWRAQQKPPA